MPEHSNAPVIAQICDVVKNSELRICKYKLRGVVASRGQSKVYRAFDPDLNREVALKIYHQDMSSQQHERVLSEGRAIARVSSPYVARCYAVESLPDGPILVNEWIDGATLSDYVADRTLRLEEVREIFRKVCLGVSAIHAQGLVHADLKPGNIMVDSQGDPRIIDFGLVISEENLNDTSLAGTYAYMSPEIARGDHGRIGRATDIFGLGGILHFLLTGHALYESDSKQEILAMARRGEPAESVADYTVHSNRLWQIRSKCLAARPGQRFSSADHIVKSLFPRRAWRAGFIVLGLALAFFLASQWAGAVEPSTIREARNLMRRTLGQFRRGNSAEAERLLHQAQELKTSASIETDDDRYLLFDYYFVESDYRADSQDYGLAEEAAHSALEHRSVAITKRPERLAHLQLRLAHLIWHRYRELCQRPRAAFNCRLPGIRARVIAEFRKTLDLSEELLQSDGHSQSVHAKLTAVSVAASEALTQLDGKAE